MPGKVFISAASRASHIAHKASSVQMLASGRSTASLTVIVPEETPTSCLRTKICTIFSDGQRTTAGHRKLIVKLRNIQEACVYDSAYSSKSHREAFDEDDFNVEIARCVIRLMGVKKTEGVGDRLIRFLGFFLRYASEKDAALISESDINDTGSFPETASTRLTSHILSILIPLLCSKDKTVRYRATQLVAHIINSLDSIDDEYYHLLQTGLLKRIRDKEPMIRVQAVLGLGRLAGNEGDGGQADAESDDVNVNGLLDKLLDVLQNDPSAEVRRSLLLNLPLTPGTLPFLLERARDVDPATRRALYSRLLPALGDFRHLSLSMREKLLRWGLRDRDENVRKATATLFRERWIEDCSEVRTTGEGSDNSQTVAPSIDGLLELLERIDVVNSGVEEGVASEAMREFWKGRSDYQEAISFDNSFWDSLSPERVFLARTFNDYCRQQGDGKHELMVEEKMPEVTKLAFILQRYTNDLVQSLRRNCGRYEGDEEEDTVEQEFIVEQLLHVAKTSDYRDEVGRRKMFSLLREILAIAELPDEITKLVVDVLRGICGAEAAGEREFCGIVLEAVAEVHDAIAIDESMADNENESFHSARSELSDDTTSMKAKGPRNHGGNRSANEEDDEAKAIKEIMVNMKCLHIAQCMLQNVEANLQHNLHLVTMLNNLVVPAVRSHEAPIRERGLLCLGLCCLLDKNLAEENLILFLHCFNKGHDVLQVTAIYVVTDILTTHPSLLCAQDTEANLQKPILKMFTKGVKAEHVPEVQLAAVTALCKLMLTSVVRDEDLLTQIVICYFDPATQENFGVRQALSYFLPVYCHSRRENMERMAGVATGVMHTLVNLSEDLNEGEEMVGLGIVGNMLVEWTDARRLVVQDEATVSWDEAEKKETEAVNGDIHLKLADSLLEQAMSHGCSKEDKKSVLTMLSKLYITANSSAEKLHTTKTLVSEAIDDKIAGDAASRNALNKLHLALNRAIGDAGNQKRSLDDTVAQYPDGGLTVVEGQELEESVLANEDYVKVEAIDEQRVVEARDSLLEELLEDEDEDL